jgi:dihydroceramidase
MYVMEVNIRPRFKKKYATVAPREDAEPLSHAAEASNAIRDKKIIKEMWQMVGVGLSIFLGGFGIWGLDIKYCSNLRSWRHEIGLPWGIFLEGHGWWHIMTGIGSYYYIVWAIWLRICLNGAQDTFMLNWKHWWNIPEVVLIADMKGKEVRPTSIGYGTIRNSRASSEESERSEDRKSV